jgi:hypothetical protein
MKRLGCLATLVSLLALPSAASAFSDGGYSGKHTGTSFGGRKGLGTLNFRVDAKRVTIKGRRVTRHYLSLSGSFTNLDVKCPDGSARGLALNFVRNGRAYAVKTLVGVDGKFSLAGTYKLYSGTGTLTFSGRLTGSGASARGSGKLSASTKVNGGTCTSANVGWSAKRAGR